MSAFIVSTTHIDAMLTAGLRLSRPAEPVTWYWPPIHVGSGREDSTFRQQCQAQDRRRELRPDTAGRIGALLLAENARSVNHRYDEEEIEQPYLFTLLPGRPDPVAALKAIDCYEYQSCEHPGWRTSEARAFCDALRCHLITALPGYDTAPWEVTDRRVFRHDASGPTQTRDTSHPT